MVVTELGMVTLVRPVQPEKAEFAIALVPALRTMLVPFGMVPLYLYATRPAYTRPSGWLLYQAVPAKASMPIDVTELGI